MRGRGRRAPPSTPALAEQRAAREPRPVGARRASAAASWRGRGAACCCRGGGGGVTCAHVAVQRLKEGARAGRAVSRCVSRWPGSRESEGRTLRARARTRARAARRRRRRRRRLRSVSPPHGGRRGGGRRAARARRRVHDARALVVAPRARRLVPVAVDVRVEVHAPRAAARAGARWSAPCWREEEEARIYQARKATTRDRGGGGRDGGGREGRDAKAAERWRRRRRGKKAERATARRGEALRRKTARLLTCSYSRRAPPRCALSRRVVALSRSRLASEDARPPTTAPAALSVGACSRALARRSEREDLVRAEHLPCHANCPSKAAAAAARPPHARSSKFWIGSSACTPWRGGLPRSVPGPCTPSSSARHQLPAAVRPAAGIWRTPTATPSARWHNTWSVLLAASSSRHLVLPGRSGHARPERRRLAASPSPDAEAAEAAPEAYQPARALRRGDTLEVDGAATIAAVKEKFGAALLESGQEPMKGLSLWHESARHEYRTRGATARRGAAIQALATEHDVGAALREEREAEEMARAEAERSFGGRRTLLLRDQGGGRAAAAEDEKGSAAGAAEAEAAAEARAARDRRTSTTSGARPRRRRNARRRRAPSRGAPHGSNARFSTDSGLDIVGEARAREGARARAGALPRLSRLDYHTASSSSRTQVRL